jgi:LysR family transcriptional regulator, nitrogen assimilation regulatory protein
MLNLRQIRSFIAVYEEGSFTRAAARENATQSGVSQHVSALEHSLGAPLFDRRAGNVVPTQAGRVFYARAIAALRSLDAGVSEVRASRGGLSGEVRAGLMPAFTRAALAPALESFVARYPQVRIEVIEGYSGALSDMVRAGSIDFAVVPAGVAATGLDQSPIARDREMLVTAADYAPTAGLAHLAPVRLAGIGPLRVVVPGRANVRRARLDAYFGAQGIAIDAVLEMDSMFGTLELVARSDWVAILPGIICAGDADGRYRKVHPLADPELHSDFVLIEPARAAMSPAARAFVAELRREIDALLG